MTATTKPKKKLKKISKSGTTRRSNSSAASEGSENKELILAVVKGTIVGTAVLFLVLSIFAVVMVKYDFSERMVPVMAMISCAAGAFSGGFWAARCVNKKGLVIGVITGLPIAILVSILSVVTNDTDVGSLLVVTIFLTLFMGSVGGITAVNSNFARKKK